MAKHFQYKVELFFKDTILDDPLGKKNIMLYVLNFKKGVAHVTIFLYGFSMHQILKMKLPILNLFRKK